MELWRVRRALESQYGNLGKLLRREPVSVVPLSGMTLDQDDVQVARHWLSRPDASGDAAATRDFEQAFARWNGSDHAFAFMAGRAALSACLEALALSPGDEVILPGYTCVVVPNAIRFAGLVPVFSDIELETYGLDVRLLESRITPRTRAILLHHLYGLVCRDYDEILSFAKSRGLFVIEDCAHATGARYRGVQVGNRGDVAFYSSEQSKVFNTIQGGVAVTHRSDLAERLALLRDRAPFPEAPRVRAQLESVILDYFSLKHPQRWLLGDLAELRYGRSRLESTQACEVAGQRPRGYGCRMPSPIAALALNQLGKIDRYNAERQATAAHWTDWATARGYRPPVVIPGSAPVFLRFPVLVPEARKLDPSWAREELGVELGVWFRSNIHPAPGRLDGVPAADQAVARCVNLPTLGVLPASRTPAEPRP